MLGTASAEDALSLDTAKLTYRYDANRSGYVDSTIAPPFALQWFINTAPAAKYVFNPKINCSIIGEGDTLYFSTLQEEFCAFDVQSKEYKWRYSTAGRVQSSATIAGDKILFGDTKGYLYCLNKLTGAVIWKRKFKVEIITSPLVVNDNIYFTDMSDTLYCVSLDAGKIIWRSSVENYLDKVVIRGTASASYSDGLVYQGFSDGYLYCYDTAAQKERFRKKVKEEGVFYDVDSPAVIDGDTVYTSSFDGSFIAIHKDKPAIKWELKIKGNGYAAYNDDNLIVSSNGGVLYNVDKVYGTIIWEKELSENLTAPVITDNYVFTASRNFFYVVDISTGVTKYEYEPGSGINTELCVIGDYVYFISNKGYLYCFKSE